MPICKCGIEFDEVAIVPEAYAATASQFPGLKPGDKLLICSACKAYETSSSYADKLEAVEKQLERLRKFNKTAGVGKYCKGVGFELNGFGYRRCIWDGEIVAAQADGELCEACGRIVKDEISAVQSIPINAVHVWIEALQIWQIVQLPE